MMAVLQAAPLEVVYTGESCACPTQLGYQLNVPNPPKAKKYAANDYGYRVEKPVQTKAKISYSFDFTVEQPRTPAPPKTNPAKLYAKVDRVTVNKAGKCTFILFFTRNEVFSRRSSLERTNWETSF